MKKAILFMPVLFLLFLAGSTLFAQQKKNIILDVDTSGDDMMAVLYLLSRPDIDIKAISIVRGVSDVEKGTEIVLRLLNLTGHPEIPVVKGADKPLKGTNAFPLKWQPSVSNPFGLNLPPCHLKASEVKSTDMIISLLKKYNGNISILAIGPLTNIAEVFLQEPSLENNICDLFISDGAVNITGAIQMEYPDIHNTVAGWNQWVDPEAADIVFHSHARISLVPLDITAVHAPHPLLLTSGMAERFTASAGNEPSKALSDIFNYWITYYHTSTQIGNAEEQAPVWDLVASIILCNPSVCTSWQSHQVRINTGGADKAGQILLPDQGEKNTRICLEGNQQMFEEELMKPAELHPERGK
jgi:inosine-uridine nucleoside N-ribohydrolase